MGFPDDSAAGLRRDSRGSSQGDLRSDSRGNYQDDFPVDLHSDSQADLQEDLQRGFPGEFDSVLQAKEQQWKRTGHKTTKIGEDGPRNYLRGCDDLARW